MLKQLLKILIPAIVLSAEVSGSVFAHHTYVKKYNAKKVITLKGIISSVSYSNPHIFFSLDVRTKGGGTGTWRVEAESIPKAQAKGLTKSRLREGAAVTITGWPARAKTGEIGLRTIKFKGGPFIKMRNSAR